MISTIDKVVAIKNKVENILSGSKINSVYDYYNNKLKIPADVLEQYFKQRLAANYIFKDDEFKNDVSVKKLHISIIKYIGFLLVILVKSRKYTGAPIQRDLLVDDIQSIHELERYLNLESYFGNDATVFISKIDFPEEKNKKHKILVKKLLDGYDRSVIKKHVVKMLTVDILWLVYQSVKVKVNLVYLAIYFLNDYFYYSTIFNLCHAKYFIHDRNLGKTNAVKNYLFIKSGGLNSSCIQKNIIQHDELALFYDVDIFFTMGKKTADDLKLLGAKIAQVVPVGSLAMESANSAIEKNISDKIDVLYIGINAVTSTRTDWSGYYKSVEWLAQVSKDNPKLKIVIKHHPSWVSDPVESEIIKNTSIEYLDKTNNSYDCAEKSKFILTYGSSMGYEFLGASKNLYFLDPYKNNPYLNEFVKNSSDVLYSINDLNFMLRENSTITSRNISSDNYCLSEQDVSRNISNYLKNSQKLRYQDLI